MISLLKSIFNVTLFAVLCCSASAMAKPSESSKGCDCKKIKKHKESVLCIDFSKPEICKTPSVITFGPGAEFNPACGQSWKLDRYDAATDEFSFMEIEFVLEKDAAQEYALELLACARKDPPLLSNVSITVNDQVAAQGYHMYNGPNSIHFPNYKNKPWHLRWEVFDISNELQEGLNKIRISLDKDTQSGIAISLLNLRATPKE